MYLFSSIQKTMFVKYLAFLLMAPTPTSFKLCGHYCGPNWCSGEAISENLCYKNKVLLDPTDAFDQCCMDHDLCCGNTDTRSVLCNINLLKCLENTNGSDECKYLNKLEMEFVFTLLSHNTCGNIFRTK